MIHYVINGNEWEPKWLWVKIKDFVNQMIVSESKRYSPALEMIVVMCVNDL